MSEIGHIVLVLTKMHISIVITEDNLKGREETTSP